MLRSAESIIVQHLRFGRFRASEADETDAQSRAEGHEDDEVDAMRGGDAIAKGADRAKRDEEGRWASSAAKRKSRV